VRTDLYSGAWNAPYGETQVLAGIRGSVPGSDPSRFFVGFRLDQKESAGRAPG